MTKIFIDTNIFIYFLDKSKSKKHNDCSSLFRLIESGKINPYTSNIVFMELVYILVKHYKQSKKAAAKTLLTLAEMRNLSIIEKSNSFLAINYFRDYNTKFGDCLIATQIPSDTTIITYDKEFSRFPNLTTMTAATILEQI